MPYRLHLPDAGHAALDRLVDLGAIDVESIDERGVTALMPDGVPPDRVASVLARRDFSISAALGRDGGSIWVLKPRPIRVGSLTIALADADVESGAVKLFDSPVFGTGLHATTALCLEAVVDAFAVCPPDRVLDVGTGSGVLALAALRLGASCATAVDIDADAVRVAAANARLNGVRDRLRVIRGGPDALRGSWPLVLANVLAAPLIELAPALVTRVGHRGRLVLSGIPHSVTEEVARAYVRFGLRRLDTTSRGEWTALLLQASW